MDHHALLGRRLQRQRGPLEVPQRLIDRDLRREGRSLESANGALVWPDYLDAGDVDMIVLEGDALDSLRFELAWSVNDDFTPARSIEQDDGAANPREVRFTLRGAPEWSGLVRRFRLTWRGEPSHASRIVAAWGKRHS